VGLMEWMDHRRVRDTEPIPVGPVGLVKSSK